MSVIAVTGIGVVSPVGNGKKDFFRAIAASKSGIAVSSNSDLRQSGASRFGEVKDFNPRERIPAMKARRMSRFSQFGLASAIEAVKDSGLTIDADNCYAVAVAVGTGLSSTDSTDRFYEGLLREGPEGTNPILFPETVQNIAASHIAIHFGIRGPNITFSHADISSELALYYGSELLRDGRSDIVLVSGADELSRAAVAGYSSLGLLCEDMMPFDLRRRGFILAEGAATVVLERLEDARKRDAHVYCTFTAPSFCASPEETIRYDGSRGSMRSSMKAALIQAGTERPDWIGACANSTWDLDRAENMAIKETFGKSAYEVPVCALRSYYGYFPSDGLLRLVGAVAGMEQKIIPATLGLDTQDPECDLDYVTGGPRSMDVKTVLLNSFSNGGTASSIILRREA